MEIKVRVWDKATKTEWRQFVHEIRPKMRERYNNMVADLGPGSTTYGVRKMTVREAPDLMLIGELDRRARERIVDAQ